MIDTVKNEKIVYNNSQYLSTKFNTQKLHTNKEKIDTIFFSKRIDKKEIRRRITIKNLQNIISLIQTIKQYLTLAISENENPIEILETATYFHNKLFYDVFFIDNIFGNPPIRIDLSHIPNLLHFYDFKPIIEKELIELSKLEYDCIDMCMKEVN